MAKILGTIYPPERQVFVDRLKHPERTAMKTIGNQYLFSEWPNRESLAKTVRLQQQRGTRSGDWRPVIALSTEEGFGHRSPPEIYLTGATYLDELGTSSARTYAPVIRRQAQEDQVALPLPNADLEILLRNTIQGLETQHFLLWDKTSSDRRPIFLNSWFSEMQRQGIAT
jgi:hypothetical protein